MKSNRIGLIIGLVVAGITVSILVKALFLNHAYIFPGSTYSLTEHVNTGQKLVVAICSNPSGSTALTAQLVSDNNGTITQLGNVTSSYFERDYIPQGGSYTVYIKNNGNQVAVANVNLATVNLNPPDITNTGGMGMYCYPP
jgi:hypothetical protein